MLAVDCILRKFVRDGAERKLLRSLLNRYVNYKRNSIFDSRVHTLEAGRSRKRGMHYERLADDAYATSVCLHAARKRTINVAPGINSARFCRAFNLFDRSVAGFSRFCSSFTWETKDAIEIRSFFFHNWYEMLYTLRCMLRNIYVEMRIVHVALLTLRNRRG